ncbi:Hypothetical predicted protein [Mytilus galloprovincialis]|uniref:Ig-like domain-containing protein n=1 Tax=Mytilus galloprovincialis TaxID=29158 RepID=A0A8B6BJJ3_MYTGA|nr:Hypothetical predicted protein [Mytilus galloprovincialis]
MNRTDRDKVVVVTDFGADATMNCYKEDASYQWKKLIGGSYQILQTSSSKYSISGRSLTIHNTNQDDSGFYQCIIFRSDGSSSGIENPIELEVKVNAIKVVRFLYGSTGISSKPGAFPFFEDSRTFKTSSSTEISQSSISSSTD